MQHFVIASMISINVKWKVYENRNSIFFLKFTLFCKGLCFPDKQIKGQNWLNNGKIAAYTEYTLNYSKLELTPIQTSHPSPLGSQVRASDMMKFYKGSR